MKKYEKWVMGSSRPRTYNSFWEELNTALLFKSAKIKKSIYQSKRIYRDEADLNVLI